MSAPGPKAAFDPSATVTVPYCPPHSRSSCAHVANTRGSGRTWRRTSAASHVVYSSGDITRCVVPSRARRSFAQLGVQGLRLAASLTLATIVVAYCDNGLNRIEREQRPCRWSGWGTTIDLTGMDSWDGVALLESRPPPSGGSRTSRPSMATGPGPNLMPWAPRTHRAAWRSVTPFR